MNVIKKVDQLKVQKPKNEEIYVPTSEQVVLAGSPTSSKNKICIIPVDIDVEED